MKNNKLKVGISIGDPNGIGIEVILKTLQNKEILEFFTPVIFASTKLLSYQKNIFGLNSIYFQGVFKPEDAIHGKINVVNLWKENIATEFGNPTEDSAKMAKNSLIAATDALEKGSIDILVNMPINNEMIVSEDFNFSTIADYLIHRFKGRPLTLLENEDLRIAMVTRTIPLAEVAGQLNKEDIKKQIKILNQVLTQDFSIEKPKIAVLSLNPFSKEKIDLGKEEIDIINPAIKECFDRGVLAFGPYSADTFFTPSIYPAFDGILAMHHDQVLIPFKNLSYENGASYIAGLPFIILSPSHGNDYSIAGQDIANPISFRQAIFDGLKIYKTRTEYLDLKQNALQKTKIEGIDTSIDEDLPIDDVEEI